MAESAHLGENETQVPDSNGSGEPVKASQLLWFLRQEAFQILLEHLARPTPFPKAGFLPGIFPFVFS